MTEPLRIDERELFTPQVDEYLDQRLGAQRAMVEPEPQSFFVRLLYANYLYLSIACVVGALLAWGILEPFFDDNEIQEEGINLAALLMFPTVAGCIGLFLGAAEGIICRNFPRAALSAFIGGLVGFLGGCVALIPAGLILTIFIAIMSAVRPMAPGQQMPTGIGLLIFMFGRSMAWAVISIPAGIGQGLALREFKVGVNGLVGAVLGGVLGGLMFDPISFVLVTPDGQALYSRAVGFAFIGLMVGFFVGLVEQWTKTAWLLMRAGPLAGKQFVLYKNPTVLGSSPKADIYLFKDEAIEPCHALIYNRGGRFEIEDQVTPDGTYVNGNQIKTQILKAGDQIMLGKTVLEFAVKDLG